MPAEFGIKIKTYLLSSNKPYHLQGARGASGGAAATPGDNPKRHSPAPQRCRQRQCADPRTDANGV